MQLTATTAIDVEPGAVYEFVSDPANDVLWRTGVTDAGLLTDPPLREGSVGFARAGRRVTRWRVIEKDGENLVRWSLVDGPFRGSGGYRIEAAPAGTRFTLLASVEPSRSMRLLGPLFRVLGSRRNSRDVARLKNLLEAMGEAPR